MYSKNLVDCIEDYISHGIWYFRIAINYN